MIRLIQRRLIIPRGDTGKFTIPVLATKNTGDVAVFSIIDTLTQKKIFEKIVEVSGEVMNIEFSHADTVNLPVGKYVWDIKFYVNPQFADGVLVDGTEVDSYYAAFTLPVCEIRQTGDLLLTADDAPTSTVSPDSLNVIAAAISEANSAKRESAASATSAANSVTEMAALVRAIPTKVSEFENDAGYLTQHQDISGKANSADLAAVATSGSYNDLLNKPFIPSAVSDLTDDSGHYTKPVGGIPATDLAETYLTSFTETDPTVPSWAKQPTKPSYTPQEIGALPADTYIPQKTSDLTNDSNYAVDANYVHTDNNYTTAEKNKLSGIAAGAEVNVNADWNASSGDAQILNKPTKVSAFTNDAGYLTSFTETDPTVPSWAKAVNKPTYTAAEVGAPTVQEMTTAISTAIGNVHQFDIQIVQALPTENIQEHTIYFVPKTGETNDVYDEYIRVNNAWEMIGNTQIDLSNYATKSEIPNVPVQDVQINGSSILSSGVANIQKASSNNLGVVGIEPQSGVEITSSGKLEINPASTADIKKGEHTNKPIVPFKQDVAAFYGLATAAGDTTQSTSSNAVGTYTTEAKAAIRSMLGAAASADIPSVPVQDVQVNGTSILNNGVANVPVAGTTSTGVIRLASNSGLFMDGTILRISKATDALIKSSDSVYFPIVPTNQHAATFYGLAKAAGADMKDISETTVGIYPDTQKAAIQSMLGISNFLAPAETTVASKAYSVGESFTSNGKLYKVTTAIAQGGTIITQDTGATVSEHNAEETKISEYAVHDISGKADKNNTVLTGSLSLGRKANTTVGNCSLAVGSTVEASGQGAIALGGLSVASGMFSFAAGVQATASAVGAYAEGTYTTASAMATHAEGQGTTAASSFSHVQGAYNVVDSSGTYAHITGNGNGDNNRSNAYALTWSGDGHYAGNIYVSCNNDSTGGTRLPHDIQINGTSIVNSGVANIPKATASSLGVVMPSDGLVMSSAGNGKILISPASSQQIKGGIKANFAIDPAHQHEASFYGLAKAAGDSTQSASSNTVGTYTSEAKAAIQSMLGIDLATIATQVEIPLVETVSGTTPTITGQPNTRYICSEVSTLSITPPASGSIDVVFESGSTASVLTVPNTVKWPAWFDATSLEKDTTYEILITDGVYGSVMTWVT